MHLGRIGADRTLVIRRNHVQLDGPAEAEDRHDGRETESAIGQLLGLHLERRIRRSPAGEPIQPLPPGEGLRKFR